MHANDRDEPVSDPGAALAEVARLRSRTRQDGRGWWFPLTLFGVLVLLATPLYWGGPPLEDQDYSTTNPFVIVLMMAFGGVFTAHPVAIAVYWLVALIVGFVGSGLWYRREAQRIGLRRPVRAFVLTGLAITFALVLLQSVPYASFLLFWVSFRGTLGIAIIAVALLVLARLERSAGLTAVAVVFLGLAVVVSTYNLENLVFPWSVIRGEWSGATAVVAPGLFLLVAGLVARKHSGRRTAEL